MTPDDHRHEQDLRAQARERGPQPAARVLADFYEQHGQLSRADLWRHRVDARRKLPVDVLVKDLTWHRKVAMWLARHEASRATVGRAFRSSDSWTRTLISEVEDAVCSAANAERHWPTMIATLRLQAAGALPPRFEKSSFVLGDPPPESWPVCPKTDRKQP